jgi:hypothetical protein
MPDPSKGPFVVRGTEILPADPPRLRLQKLARITLDSMVQFVGLHSTLASESASWKGTTFPKLFGQGASVFSMAILHL